MDFAILKSWIRCLLLTVILLASSQLAFADYYKYTDSSGNVCMTNNLQSVPKKYRSSMKVIKEESLNKRDAAQQKPQQQAAPATVSAPAEKVAEEPPKPQTRFDQLSARFPWLKPLLIISALLGSCFVVVKLTSFLPSQMLARVICLAFFLGIFVFTYKAYADYMVKSYTDIKEKMLQMFKKSNVREAPVPGEDGATPSNVPSVPDK